MAHFSFASFKVEGEKISPLAEVSASPFETFVIESFSSKVTIVTPILNAPTCAVAISAEFVESIQSASLSPGWKPYSRSPYANALAYLYG